MIAPVLRCECPARQRHLAACKRQKTHKWCRIAPVAISSHAKQLLRERNGLQRANGVPSNPTCFHCLAGKKAFAH